MSGVPMAWVLRPLVRLLGRPLGALWLMAGWLVGRWR